jgi:FkbM family methyltransferase
MLSNRAHYNIDNAIRKEEHDLHDAALPWPTVTVGLEDFKLTVPAAYQPNFRAGVYEPLSSAWLKRKLCPGNIAVDAGAYAGYYTLLMAMAVSETGRVIAIEPGPANLNLLRMNVWRHTLGNVVIVAAGCGREAGRRPLLLSGIGSTNGFYGQPHIPVTGEVEVPLRRLDDLIDSPVDLVKIDVEGAELETLEGMDRLLRELRSLHLLVEWNPGLQRRAGNDPQRLPRVLMDLGFEVVVLDDTSGQSMPVAELLRGDPQPDGWWCNLACTPASWSGTE